jgi:hypothetical protein
MAIIGLKEPLELQWYAVLVPHDSVPSKSHQWINNAASDPFSIETRFSLQVLTGASVRIQAQRVNVNTYVLISQKTQWE